MKNTIKKAISVLLIAVMVFGAAPLAGFVGLDLPELNLFSTKAEAATEYTSGYYTYRVSDGKARIYDVNTSISGDVIIPSTLGGYPVTEIGDYAFRGCEKITSVTIPDGVTSIGEEAFNSCTKLTSVIIPDSVTSIGEGAFFYCERFTSITIPDGITSIGQDAFYRTGYYRDASNWEDGILYIGKYLVDARDSISGSRDIKKGTKVIADHAFHSCESLTSITIPDSVTNIGNWAFYICISLTNIIIPDSVTSIGEGAFCYCERFTSITIPDSITSIAYSAFNNCKRLENITIPDSVTSIGDYAFNKCTSLVDVYYKGTEAEWCAISIGSYNDNLLNATIHYNYVEETASGTCGDNLIWKFYESTGELIISGTGAMTDWSSYSYVPWHNYRENITFVEICEGITSIGEYAFAYCNNLKKAIIFKGVASIGDCAFLECKSLTEITIPQCITSIGKSSFESTAVTEIIIPYGVTSIGYRAFYNCADLKSVVIPKTVTLIGDNAFCDCLALETISIGNGIETIGYNAFFDCVNIKDVYYADIKSEWSKVFVEEGNETLLNANIHFEPTVVSGEYGDGILWTLNRETGELIISGEGELPDKPQPELVSWHIYMNSIKSVVISEGITYIGELLFNGCLNLESIEIPASVKSIGNSAFLACYNLKNVSFADNSKLENIGRSAFHGCIKLDVITIPVSVKSIGDYAFELFDDMTDVYYEGTDREWIEISIGDFNTSLRNATIHFAYYYVRWIIDDYQYEIKQKVGEEFPIPAFLPKDGFTCVGWDKSVPNIMPAEHLEFTALYVANTYSATWDIDGVIISAEIQYESQIGAPVNPTKSGYKFMGWTPEIPESMPAYDMTFTAVFEKVFICPGCGNEILGEDAINKHIISETKVTVSDGVIITSGEVKPYATITVSAPRVDGKIFSHWSVEGATVEDVKSADTKIVLGSGKITITAEYEDCDCKCHKGGIAGFFFKIVLFFQKLFGNNLECFCGKNH